MILGAGAAGATAAIRACRQGLKVILIDRAAESAVGASGQNVAEWVSSQVGELLAEMQIEADFLLDQPFSGLVFHSADLKRVAESPPEELSWKQSSGNLSSGKLSNKLPAFRVNYSKCVEHLRAAAAREGATILEAEPSRVELG
ncbi:MAG: FAD-dependent oxidoreductase, partial [Phycisphaerae bacterium]|nr:FAD-dependent oxidoreductase [Phycisphaerae bacterium]